MKTTDRRHRQPDPDCKTRRAARWLAENPDAPVSVAADMFDCYAGAIRTAWCRMYPGVSLARRAILPLLAGAAVHRSYVSNPQETP